MAYELFLLPVAPGADPEEAGEALLARLADVSESVEDTPADPACAALVATLRDAEPTLAAAPPRPAAAAPAPGRPVPVTEMRDANGIEVTVARGFARFRVPFQHRGDDAESVFERLFRMLDATARATGWRLYDPQEAEPVPLDDAGRDATLEIYLTVMDQIRPSGAGAPVRRRAPPG